MKRVILPATVRPSADINVTPLVDVVLVLLIIFMVATPLSPLHLPLELPDPAAAPSEDRPPPELHVSARGGLTLDRTPFEPEALARELRNRRPATLLVTAEDDADYARLVDALDLARASGIQSFTFALP